VTKAGSSIETTIETDAKTAIKGDDGKPADFGALRPGLRVSVNHREEDESSIRIVKSESAEGPRSILGQFWYNFRHNLFKPLLLFFYMGFLFPILKVKFEFPYVIYQGLTIYLLIAIGWKGGEELAELPAKTLSHAVGFMFVGFCLNFVIGVLAYLILSAFTRMRRVDKATVAGYYGSDSAGTFVTCVGVLTATNML